MYAGTVQILKRHLIWAKAKIFLAPTTNILSMDDDISTVLGNNRYYLDTLVAVGANESEAGPAV